MIKINLLKINQSFKISSLWNILIFNKVYKKKKYNKNNNKKIFNLNYHKKII